MIGESERKSKQREKEKEAGKKIPTNDSKLDHV